jgi:hypothetical protein
MITVPLILDAPRDARDPQPVTLGVPFPPGQCRAGAWSLTGPDGKRLPIQAQPLATWADGSVKWLLLDFVLDAVAAGRTELVLQPSDAGSLGGLRVTESGPIVTVDTGRATFHLSRTRLPLLERVTAGGADRVGPGSVRCLLTAPDGKRAEGRVETFRVEARGPVRATVFAEGTFAGSVACRFQARLSFFARTDLVRLVLTLHNPNRARHAGGLWDLGDPGSLLFRDLSLEIGVPHAKEEPIRWTTDAGASWQQAAAGALEIYQDSSGGANWQSRNHVNREGRVPCSFPGFRVRAGGRETHGARAEPVVAAGGVTAAVPEFWQQFPKAVEVEGGVLRVRLFPGQFADLFELQGGEQKTHTVWLAFAGGAEAADRLAWVHAPADVHAPPEWYAAGGVVPHLQPARPAPDDRLEGLLRGAVEGENSLFARREVIDEYGWRHYGETYADHEEAHYQGPKPVVSHYNNQYDVVYGAVLQYLRTGDRRWAGLFGPLARHVIDIDIYHTTRDKAAYNGGLFWFTDHYRDAATCTHRTYSRANCQPGDQAYGGGPSSNHLFTTGLLHYHYLTGDPLARDAVLELAGWVRAMDDGAGTPFGLIDSGPTGLASYTGEPDYHGPGRGGGNSVNALLDAWLLTGQEEYLEAAEALIRRCVHPTDSIPALDLLNVEKRWSYTVLLSVLARYLDEKAAAGRIDRTYTYAQQCLVRYAAWMREHERPTLDRPEDLEFPTETWAVQDLRKANVLRLAAAHAGEPLRHKLHERGNELAGRAWDYLMRFPSRGVTRSLALLMTEGTQDAALREPLAPRPRSETTYDFGQPQPFVPQRTRVMSRLKSVRGLAGVLAALCQVRRLWGLNYRLIWQSLR